jgi:hypothetical protein
MLNVSGPYEILGQTIKFMNTGFKNKYTRSDNKFDFFEAPLSTGNHELMQFCPDF